MYDTVAGSGGVGAFGSVTVTLSSTKLGLTVLQSTLAVPWALVVGEPKAVQVAVAVLVWLAAAGAAE